MSLNKFSLQANGIYYKLQHPLTVDQLMAIEDDLPICIVWIKSAHYGTYDSELVNYFGHNNKKDGIWFGSNYGLNIDPERTSLKFLKTFVKRRKISKKTPIYNVTVQDRVYTVHEIVVTDERIELHMQEISGEHYE